MKNKLKGEAVYCLAEVSDIPVQKSKTLKVNFKLLQLKTDTAYISVKGNVIAYVQNSQLNKRIVPGSVYLLHTNFQEIKEPMNPYAFNFKSYLNNHSVYHTTYVDSNSLSVINVQMPLTVWQAGLSIKNKIILRLKESGLSKDAYSICSALITGFDDEIDKSVLESFSHSGTLHVLSVSGLHVGLIYLVLNYVLGSIDREKKFKILQLLLISFILWGFALITGFSAPVLRSVIMFNLLGFGNIFFRNRPYNQINILVVSAFILLLYDPLLIRDIGFLLSYSALFGILYFYPKLEKLVDPQNKFVKYIWQSTAVSVSATIATLPITLMVFHQFPIWFAFANLIIVPATSFLLFLSFAALLKLSFVVWFINKATVLLISFIGIFNSDSYAFIDYVDFNWVDSVCLVIVLGSLAALILKRSYSYALLFFSFVIGWQFYSILNSYDSKSKKELVIYQIPKSGTVSVKNKTKVLVNRYDSLNYTMHVKPNLVSYNNAHINFKNFNYVSTDTIGLLILDQKNRIPENLNMKISHLLISNNAIPEAKFFDQVKLKMLIADGSNTSYTLNKLEKICTRYQIDLYLCKNKGALIFPL